MQKFVSHRYYVTRHRDFIRKRAATMKLVDTVSCSLLEQDGNCESMTTPSIVANWELQ